MISDKHNFRKNFANATGVNDDDMALDVILNEINELIIENPLGVIAAIKTSGLTVSEIASNKKLATLICENMGTNVFLQKKIMALILTREGNAYLHADGGKGDVVLSPELAASVDILAIEAGKLMERSLQNKIIPKKQLEMLAAKEKQRGIKSGMGWKAPTAWVVGGAAVIALIWGVSKLVSSNENKETPAILPT